MYYLVNALLVLAIAFFFVLPMTDRRTARMKLCMVCALAAARPRARCGCRRIDLY